MKIPLTPELALRLIAGFACSVSTSGPGSWLKPGSGRRVGAPYGADAVCDQCLAWAALREYEDGTL